jgi:hypothetical protein
VKCWNTAALSPSRQMPPKPCGFTFLLRKSFVSLSSLIMLHCSDSVLTLLFSSFSSYSQTPSHSSFFSAFHRDLRTSLFPLPLAVFRAIALYSISHTFLLPPPLPELQCCGW